MPIVEVELSPAQSKTMKEWSDSNGNSYEKNIRSLIDFACIIFLQGKQAGIAEGEKALDKIFDDLSKKG